MRKSSLLITSLGPYLYEKQKVTRIVNHGVEKAFIIIIKDV
jgi:hypothetical protein